MIVHEQDNGYVYEDPSGFIAVLMPNPSDTESEEPPFKTKEEAIAFLNRN